MMRIMTMMIMIMNNNEEDDDFVDNDVDHKETLQAAAIAGGLERNPVERFC